VVAEAAPIRGRLSRIVTVAAPREELVLEAPLAVRAILRRSAPRIVRDALGPLASFFVGWKLFGLVVGIFCATAFALVMYRRERRHGRPAMVVRVALGLVLLRAVVGLVTGDAKAYLGQDVAIDAVLGLAVLGSVVVGRPLGELFAREVYPFPEPVRASDTYRHTFRSITLAWGAYFLARCSVRLVALILLSVDGYLLVAALSGAPLIISMLAWSIVYTTRRFRRSEEWGGAIVAAEAAEAGAVELAAQL
jgi:hypothetical protein